MTLTQRDLGAIKQLVDDSLTKEGLGAIKQLVDDSITEHARQIKQLIDDSIDERVPGIIDERINARVPQIVQPMLNRLESSLEKRLMLKLDQLTLDVGQFSLETTDNFLALNGRLDDLEGGLAIISEMTDNNRVEVLKLKPKQA